VTEFHLYEERERRLREFLAIPDAPRCLVRNASWLMLRACVGGPWSAMRWALGQCVELAIMHLEGKWLRFTCRIGLHSSDPDAGCACGYVAGQWENEL
jgi:hypothetical protein